MPIVERSKRDKADHKFITAEPSASASLVQARLEAAWARWTAPTQSEAESWLRRSEEKFPDEHPPDAYWTEGSSESFVDFFAWGHNHDFGHGVSRSGAMGPRHIEIIGECMEYGLLPTDLSGMNILNVGCWSGGDLLLLSGLGAQLTAIEEHKKSAASAEFLCDLVGANCTILTDSLFSDRQDWAGKFDVVYCSGVIYHVTDPLLLCRIAFAYLKPGGRLILETKAIDAPGSLSGYSGTLEYGWNWYAPNEEVLGRWLVDAGFPIEDVRLRRRENGRLLSGSVKKEATPLPERAGFSRPGSWLEGRV
ncbi:MAG: methyltransferase domain-containing protein [Pseudomonadota bacterium]